MVLRLLFTVHATLTVAAGIVLVIAPAAIPHAVGIIVTPPAFLLCYLLAAAELCIGLISWGARNLTDTHAIRLIATSFILTILGVVLQIVMDHASLPLSLIWPIRVGALTAPLMVAGGFFGVAHIAGLRWLLYVGAVTVVITTLMVGIGLVRAR
jgi:hypothetical protein